MSSLEAHSGEKGVVQGLVLVQGPVNDCTYVDRDKVQSDSLLLCQAVADKTWKSAARATSTTRPTICLSS